MKNKRLKTLQDKRATTIAAMKSIVEMAGEDERDLTEDEGKKFDDYKSSVTSMDTELERLKALDEMEKSMPSITDSNADTATEIAERNGEKTPRATVIPPNVKRWGKLRCFKGPKADETAYRFGQWIRAANGITSAREWCGEHGVDLVAVAQEKNNSAGGFLVLPEFDNDMIDLRKEYGVFRREARTSPMSSDTKERSRKTGGLTAYHVGESEAGTESTGSWDRVALVAKKIMVLTRMSNELSEDAIISVADDIADDISRAFAYREDIDGFLGDGTSTYGNIMGLCGKLIDVNGVDTGGGLIAYGTGYAWTNITLAHFNSLIGILPDIAHANAKFYCTRTFFHQVIEKLLAAAGGNTILNLEDGAGRRQLFGYPIAFAEIMPTAAATSKIQCLFGDLRLAADFGDRRSTSISFSDSAYVGSTSVFERDEIAVRATERFDINCHDVGSATVAGPVVGLISHSA